MEFNPDLPVDGSEIEALELRNQFNSLDEQNTATNQRIDNLPPPQPGPPGADGAPGANGADGRSINPRGVWVDSETYNRLDLVSYNNGLYLCTEDNTSMATPGVDPRWMATQINVTISEVNGQLTVNGNLTTNGSQTTNGMNYSSGLGLGVNDAGGSGESGLLAGSANNGDGHLLRIAGRNGGADQYAAILDPAGVTGNMGQPTVQHGDLMIADMSSGNLVVRPWHATVQTMQVMGADGNPKTITFIAPPA